MRILVLGIRGCPNVMGGIETCCQNLYPRVVENGHEVTILSRACYTGKREYSYKGVRIIPYWAPRRKNLEAIVHTFLGTLFTGRYKPDIVHYHAMGPAFFVPFSKWMGYKVVATHHGFDYDRDKWGKCAKTFLKMGEKNLCRADAVTVPARYLQQSLMERFNCPSELIVNGSSVKPILPFGQYCRKWDLESKKYFLFTGRLVPEKCIHILFDAFEKIDTDWKLVIAGDADHEDDYSFMIKKRSKSLKNVIMTGYIKQDEKQEIFSNAGCCVLASSHEGLPLAILEALSYGVPCIASKIPANLEIDFKTVQHFPLNDVAALQSLMMKAINGELSKNAFEGREYIEKNFNWDDLADKLVRVYEQLK